MYGQPTPNPQIVDEHREGHLGGTGHPKGPVPGRGVPTTSARETQQGLRWAVPRRRKVAGNPCSPRDALAYKHSPGFRWRGGRDTRGKAELCGLRAGAGGTAAPVPVWSLRHPRPTGGRHLFCSSVEPSPNEPTLRLHWSGRIRAAH